MGEIQILGGTLTLIRKQVVALVLASAMAGAVALPTAAQAATGGTLYVDDGSATCTDSGTGTQAAPYCTIQAAANAAGAGDTVLISGDYSSQAPLTFAKSGTATAPITFQPAQGRYFGVGVEIVVSGSYIDISGLSDTDITTALDITGSHVTLDRSLVDGDTAATILTGSGVTGLTVQRSLIYSSGGDPAVELGKNNSDTVLSTDEMRTDDTGQTTPAVEVNDDTGTDIVSNTFEDGCAGISVSGSSGTVIENDVIDGFSCPAQTGVTYKALSVDAASSASTTEGYNVLSTVAGQVVPYTWAAIGYATQAEFTAATGQGATDTLESSLGLGTGGDPTAADAAALGSANASAPGELSADVFGNPWGATPDRGAVHFADFSGASVQATNLGPQEIDAGLDLQGVAWGSMTQTVDWGDGTAVDSSGADDSAQQWYDFSSMGEATHMYAQRGTYTITMTLSDASQTVTKTTTVTTGGATFASVAPTRVLDTRHGTGAPAAKVKPNSSVSFNVTKGVTLPTGLGTITAVVMNVTVTDATASGFVTAYPTGSAVPSSSNLNFSAGQTVPNLVTVKVGAGDLVSLLNSSGGSSDLIADVEGYYVDSAAGGSYLSNTPKRVLDTRHGIGAVSAPVAAGGVAAISVPQCTSGSGASAVSATATAVAVNVTVVSPTANGLITAYPDQTGVPTASNVNYRTGQTVPNLVVVKVGSDGKVDFKNTSTGTAELVVDLEGCYSTSLGSAFVPVTPYRALDTRKGIGQESAAGLEAQPDSSVIWWTFDDFAGLSGLSGLVMNITATQGQDTGVLTAYPLGPDSTVPTASNVNYATGQTVANLAMVAAGPSDFAIYNTSKGKVQVIADVFGYFS